MDIASISIPNMTLRFEIVRPRGHRIRMALLTAALWLAGRVAPSHIDVTSEITTAD